MIIENDMEMVKSVEESGLLIKRISKAIKNEAKGDSFLGKLLKNKKTIRAGEGRIRAGQVF